MSEATFTIYQTPELQWGVRRESNGCGWVSDEKFTEPIAALLHASSRAGSYFPATIRISKAQKKVVSESLSDYNWEKWVAEGMMLANTAWDGEYDGVVASEDRDDYIGED